jgi:lysophospholipase L1-like esterase
MARARAYHALPERPARYHGGVRAWRRGAEAGLLALGILAALLVGELAARLIAARQRGGGYAPVRTDTRERRPINSRGYRDLERTIPKPARVRRVVCLGDSFTWGVGVLFGDAWPQRVERLLARDGQRWEAVNLGEPGLNTVQEASKLDAEGLAYGPDVVVLAYVLNDSEDANAAETRRAADWLEDRRRAASAPPSLLDRSALLSLVRVRLKATIENRRRIADFHAMYAEDYQGWAEGRRALRAIGGLCRAHGVPLVVAIFPLFGNPLDDSYPFTGEHAKVASAAAEAGAKVLDLLPQYRGLDWRLLVVDGAADEHPNEVAHRIAAQAIARAVRELVPGSESGQGPLRP